MRFAFECVLKYSVGLLLTVVPARDGGRLLSSGRTVVARDAVDLAGTTVRASLSREERRDVWERVSLDERRRDVDEPQVRDLEWVVDACVIAVGAR